MQASVSCGLAGAAIQISWLPRSAGAAGLASTALLCKRESGVPSTKRSMAVVVVVFVVVVLFVKVGPDVLLCTMKSFALLQLSGLGRACQTAIVSSWAPACLNGVMGGLREYSS